MAGEVGKGGKGRRKKEGNVLLTGDALPSSALHSSLYASPLSPFLLPFPTNNDSIGNDFTLVFL
jgi:hypothetical protein